MKNVRVIVLSLIAVSSFASVATGQSEPKKSVYDADLAKKLGGNDNGMKGYVFVMLRTGPNDGNYKGKEREDLFAGHMANIGRLADMGKLILAGPFDKNDRSYRGIFVFDIATVEEATKLVETDPTVKAGVLVADVIPWWGTAALMAIPEIHPKIMKPKK
jgi:uncharacterized protein YciI